MSAPHRRHNQKDEKPKGKLLSTTVAGKSDAHEDRSSRSILRINSLKEEYISDYIYFHIRIQTILSKLRSMDSSEQIVLLFTASELPHSRQSWCNECNYLEAILASYMRRAKHLTGYLVRVKVGIKEEWNDRLNPYRTDPATRIKSVPTLMVWNSGKRLSGAPIFEVDQLVALFDGNVVVKPNPETEFHNRSKNNTASGSKKLPSSTFRTTRRFK